MAHDPGFGTPRFLRYAVAGTASGLLGTAIYLNPPIRFRTTVYRRSGKLRSGPFHGNLPDASGRAGLRRPP